MPNEDYVLQIKGLKTYFYTDAGVVRAVDDVSLNIGKTEILGLVGESGCGKSQLAFSVMRLTPFPGRIVGGEILFEGEDLLKKNEREIRKIRGTKIGMIFQDPMSSLNPVFKIGFQVGEGMKLHQKLDNRETDEKVLELLKKVGLPDPTRRMKDYPHQFSGGMRQRVMISIALSCNPKLLIADEPTTNLDVTVQAQILELVKKLREEFQSSILLITHDFGVAAELSDNVAVMYAGKIVEFSDVRSIFKSPEHPYTKALLQAIPRADVRSSNIESIPGNVPRLINPPPGCRFHPRCKYAKTICTEVEPELKNIGTKKKHCVACHLNS